MKTTGTATELDTILAQRRRLLGIVALTVAATTLVTAVVLVLGLTAPAAAASESSSAAASGISIVAWQAERNGTAVWRGSPNRFAQTRFLRGARLPALAAGSSSVAYVRYAGNGFDVYLTGSYAGWEMKLAHVAGTRTTSVAVSPDGRRVAFATPTGIEFVVNAAGFPRRAVPLPARWRGSRYGALVFSPDGRRLAFSRTWGDGRAGTLRDELAVIGIDGTGARSLARNPDAFGSRYDPVFTPDGMRIAFPAANGSLATVSVGGGPVTRLTQPPRRVSDWKDGRPVYSADGRWVAFTRSRGRGPSEVHVVRADGSGLRQLTITPPPTDPGQPGTGSIALAWSPDGTSVLAFRRDEFAAVGLVSGESTTIARVGVQYSIGSAAWH
jgi:Tol biopolymer transport system component